MNDEQETRAGGFAGYLSTTATLSVQSWHWFSCDQAVAAVTFARKCGDLEANPKTPSDEERARGLAWSADDQRDYRSYAIASIFSSVAFLEASINELFASASYSNLEVGGSLAEAERECLVGAADLIERNNLLDKFQLALYLLHREAFDAGNNQSYQDAKILVSLRNELVHYKPRFRAVTSEFSESAKWARALYGKRFSLNPFTGSGNAFFPDKCLSYGCTAWAWNAALSFTDDFYNRVGVRPVYDAMRQSLTL
jgi:hypothetical protein